MLLKRGLQNNRDPSVTYTVRDIEDVFHDLLSAASGVTVEGSARLSAVSAAHRIYTNSIATLPWMVRRKVGDTRLDEPHYLDYILKIRPNDYFTPYDTWKMQLSQAFWHGSGYIWIGRAGGRVTELLPLPSAGHTRRVDPATGQIWHFFTVPTDAPGGKPPTFSCQDSDLLVHHFETYNGVSGVGVLDMARDVISTDLAAQKYNSKFYTNGARVSGVLEVPSDLSTENRERARDQFEHLASGPDNAFRTAVLDLGIKYTQLGITQRESQYLESRAFAVEEMSRITGIPGYMLQTGKQSYQSNEQQQLDFVISTLTPPVTQMEQECMRKLLRRDEIADGWYLKRNLAARLRGDNKSRAEYYQIMMGISSLCADEIRAMEEQNPLPEGRGQHFILSKNYDFVENFEKGAD